MTLIFKTSTMTVNRGVVDALWIMGDNRNLRLTGGGQEYDNHTSFFSSQTYCLLNCLLLVSRQSIPYCRPQRTNRRFCLSGRASFLFNPWLPPATAPLNDTYIFPQTWGWGRWENALINLFSYHRHICCRCHWIYHSRKLLSGGLLWPSYFSPSAPPLIHQRQWWHTSRRRRRRRRVGYGVENNLRQKRSRRRGLILRWAPEVATTTRERNRDREGAARGNGGETHI